MHAWWQLDTAISYIVVYKLYLTNCSGIAEYVHRLVYTYVYWPIKSSNESVSLTRLLVVADFLHSPKAPGRAKRKTKLRSYWLKVVKYQANILYICSDQLINTETRNCQFTQWAVVFLQAIRKTTRFVWARHCFV